MFEIWITLVFVYLAVLLPLSGARRMGALAGRPSHPGVRPWQLDLYPRIVIAQWFLAGAVVIAMWRFGVMPAQLGLRAPTPLPSAVTAGVLAIGWIVWQVRLRRALHDPARRRRLL